MLSVADEGGQDEPVDKRSLFESTIRTHSEYGRAVVVKCPRRDAAALEDLNSLLRNSYENVRHWKHPHIIRPIDCFERDGRVHVVHPYFGEARALCTEDLCERAGRILGDIFTAVEFVHQMGFVHCDLKAENILVLRHGERLWPLLTDFDFVAPAGTLPNARIFGSPLHIAPEILRDEIILPQSDFYSLGAMILLLCHRERRSARARLADLAAGNVAAVEITAEDLLPELRSLEPLIRSLVLQYHSERPSNLGRALAAVIPGCEFSSYERRLLCNLLTSRFAKFATCHPADPSIAGFADNDSQTFGILRELLLAADRLRAARPVRTYRTVRRLLSSAEIIRVAHFWQVSLSLPQSFMFLRLLDPQSDQGSNPLTGADVQLKIRTALRARVRKQRLRAALLFSEIIDQPIALTDSQLDGVRFTYALTLRELGFTNESGAIVRELYDRGLLSLHKQIAMLLTIADQFAVNADAAEQTRALRKASQLARRAGLVARHFRAVEKQLILMMKQGRIAAATVRAQKLLRFAERIHCRSAAYYMANVVGSLFFVAGRPRESAETFREALRKFTEDAAPAPAPLVINLAMAHNRLGEYHKAMAACAELPRDGRSVSDLGPLLYLEANALHAHIMLGRFDGAEQCLARLLAVARQRSDRGAITLFYLRSGWLALRSGNVARAQSELEYARRLMAEGGIGSIRSEVCYYLGTAYLLRGDRQRALALANEISAAFPADYQGYDRIDGQLLAALASPQSEDRSQQQLLSVAHEYLRISDYFGLCLTLSYLLVNRQIVGARDLLDAAPALREYLSRSGGLIALALQAHLRALQIEPLLFEQSQLGELKIALGHYRRGGFLIQALHLCRELAAHYEQSERRILQLRYLEEALRISTQMMNSREIAQCRAEIAKLMAVRQHRSANTLLLEVSRILRSIADYNRIAEKLLEFAVAETGAERGALLITTEGGTNLRVEAVIEIDDASIEDVKTVSRSVMRTAFENNEAVFVDDASRDERTNTLASVLAHNILAIACVPLISGDKVAGVLYLDHHSVPGIFHDDERRLIEAVANLVGTALAHARLLRTAQLHERESLLAAEARGQGTNFVTRNGQMLNLLSDLPLIARAPSTVLLKGESGTGKDVMARLIHENSRYADGPFLSINCANLTPELADSNLFGIKDRVATGVGEREGKFMAADGGTLFLDEIGDLPLSIQPKLLKAIEEKRIEKVGTNRMIDIDVRIIVATNKDLPELIRQDKFRRDLFERINTITIELTPLRDRKEDIEPLFFYFSAHFAPNREYRLAAATLSLLRDYDWPGNVRELRNAVERMTTFLPGGTVRPEDLMRKIGGVPIWVGPKLIEPPESKLEDRVRKLEYDEFLRILRKHCFVQAAAARELGMALSTFQRRLKDLGIDPKNPPIPRDEIVAALRQSRNDLTVAAKILNLSKAILLRLIKGHGIDLTKPE